MLPLPQLQGRETQELEDDRESPQPYDDLRLAPPALLEVVVDRRHPENALAPRLVRGDLHDDGERLGDEQPADDDEEELLLDQDRDRAERTPESHRADVAHEDLRGVRVEPEEPERGAEQRPAENRQLARALDERDRQVVGDDRVPRGVGEEGECDRRDEERADREAVEAVGQVDRVGGAGEDESREERVEQSQEHGRLLEEGEGELGREEALVRHVAEQDADGEGQGDLQRELPAGRQPQVVLARDLHVVVPETDRPEGDHRRHRDPDERVAEVGPEQGRRHDRGDDEDPAHRRRAALGLVRLRALLADLLADLEAAEAVDEPPAEEERDQHRGDDGHRRPEGDVAEDVEGDGPGVQLVEEVVEHQAAVPPRARSASTTCSRWIPREPLTTTRSPSRTRPGTRRAAEVASSATWTSTPPRRADSAALRESGPTATSSATPAAAARSPAARWNPAAWAPSSSMSPMTSTRRPAGSLAESVPSTEARASGLLL